MSILTAELAGSMRVFGPTYVPSQKNNDDDIRRHLEELFATHLKLLSDYRPENSIRFPISVAAERVASPSGFHPDEVLDWDTAIEVAPKRPSGTLMVTLKYAGRGTPTPAEDPWD